MPIKDFDYKGFADNLAAQAAELVPKELKDNEKSYIINTLQNFATIAGEALYQDQDNLGFSAEQATMITQIIAEWAFHKSVDLIRSGIPQQYWDPIMQKIAFTIFEIAKQTFKQEMPQDQILQLVEHHVKKTYLDSIAELKEKGLIDQGLMDQAAAQSNIDTTMQQMQQTGELPQQQPETEPSAPSPQDEQPQLPQLQSDAPVQQTQADLPSNPNDTKIVNKTSIKYEPPKLLKLVTVALLLKRMEDEEQVQEILECFDQTDAGTVIKYMYIDGIEKEINPNTTTRILEDIAKSLPETVDASKKKLVQKTKELVEKFGRNKMEKRLQYERYKVRQFVFNAADGEFYNNVSPKVANIIARYVGSIV